MDSWIQNKGNGYQLTMRSLHLNLWFKTMEEAVAKRDEQLYKNRNKTFTVKEIKAYESVIAIGLWGDSVS